MHPSLAFQDHRPWPLPARPWAWRQEWRDLLFAHWRVEPAMLRPLIPPGLTLQQFDGSAWIGVVPFRMRGVMRRGFPDLPWISAFPELNVRTYVERDGRPGVWFLSLDAANPLAVEIARRFFHLPYFHARMNVVREGARIDYQSTRGPFGFEASYAPTSEPYLSIPGSLDHWLTERYCLYARDRRGALWRNEVHHPPWPLQKAEADLRLNTMLRCHQLDVAGPPPLLHLSEGVEVVAWSADRVG